MLQPNSLNVLTGALEVKFKAGAFPTWSDSFVRLEGRWICVYKRERDSLRQGAIELGLGVSVTDLTNPEASAKFPRRFDLTCNGGLLSKTEMNFRAKSRKDRDSWVQAITWNLQCLASARGRDPNFGIREMVPIAIKMQHDLPLHPTRIHSDLTLHCVTGESIVTLLVAQERALDRIAATELCRQLVMMNLLHHVMWDRDFTDSAELFVIVVPHPDVDSPMNVNESSYFSKYLDSRKFWRYIASPDETSVDSLMVASHVSCDSQRVTTTLSLCDRSTRSLDSVRGASVTLSSDDQATRYSSLSISNDKALTSDYVTESKAKKCAVCTKSFNLLRRRHYCHRCRAANCGNCCVIRRSTNSSGQVLGGVSFLRICVTCKLNSNASTSDEADHVVDGKLELYPSQSDSDVLTSTSSRSGRNGSRSNGYAASSRDTQVLFCCQCNNENCMPLTEVEQISYPVIESIDASFVVAKRLDNEAERLKSVESLMATMAATPSATRVLRQFCNMAAIASQCPVAIVGLLDRETYVLGSQYGVCINATVPRNESFAAHTCRYGTSLVCADLTRDVRFMGNPWRLEGLKKAAFYAGIPLILPNGHIVGALEVFDLQPRYECGDVLNQLHTVVRGLLNLFQEIMTAAAETQREQKEIQAAAKKAKTPAVNPMEAQLLQLLSQTTTTQEQLRTQQGQMVSAINSHSRQIDNLAKQLERIEASLTVRLNGEERTN